MALPISVSSSYSLVRRCASWLTDIVFQRQPQLQGQAHHQPRAGRAEHAALRVRKKDDSEIVFARLQADCRQIADFRVGEKSA